MTEKKFKMFDFKNRWKEKVFMKLKSEEIDNNPILLKSGKNYKTYFDHILDMNMMLDYETIQEKGSRRVR